ncbi:MAG: hypothetical protein PHH54_03035 [Candidatus Nanoarchaeia archaeon]|nr:hypothetical protein [Candidatus Nanoarchaeia archaeon]MDD5740935.1 hypothetical protein [Candidatus Nanoarchaeia archaeon]
MSKTKREILAELAKKEALGREELDKKFLNCGSDFCPFVIPAETNLYDFSTLQNSPDFKQTSKDFRENYSRDHLNVSGRIISDFFEQEGIHDGYEPGEIGLLERHGMHITDNPGFGRS